MASNVKLIDPHDSNINLDIVNSIPQYQDMYISAELIGIKRGRTVLTTNSKGSFVNFHEKSGSNSDTIISFLGEDKDRNEFTTNWYDGSIGSEMIQYEGFGITNINILVNSSYIPQINIDFVDIRGLAFFNRENSPYRILFDFPPPIFRLSFKGYYGKEITYQMHLVKYTTEFKSDTGNYNISCEFIAISYAPLTDVLFRHIVQVALFGDFDYVNTLSPNPEDPPINTLDLVLKLKNLYSVVGKKVKSDIDNKRYESAQKSLKNYMSVYDILGGYYNNVNLKKHGTPILFMYDEIDGGTNIRIIKYLNEYDGIIKDHSSLDVPNYVDTHLYIGFLNEVNTSSEDTEQEDTEQYIQKSFDKEDVVRRSLIDYGKHLTTQANSKLHGETIEKSDFNDVETIIDRKSISAANPKNNITYTALDVTYYYFKIYNEKNILEAKKNVAMTNLNEKINAMVQTVLGMKPTIYNIFKILLDDVDTYFQKLRTVSIESESHHKKYIDDIITEDSGFMDKKHDDNNKKIIFPFPLIVESETNSCLKTEVRRAPTKLSLKLGEPFPEVTFIQEFIDSFITANHYIRQYTLKTQQDSRGDNKWIPFTPLDSLLVTDDQRSPYWGTDTPAGGTENLPIDLSSLNKLNRIFEIVLIRFYVFSQNTIPYTFYEQVKEVSGNNHLYNITSQTTKDYIELYGKAEAINLVNSMFNLFYLNMLKNVSIRFRNNPNEFYIYLEKELNSLYTGTPVSYKLSLTDPIYVTKNNIVQYKGFDILTMDGISTRIGKGENKILDDFFNTELKEKWNAFWSGKPNKEIAYKWTSENIIQITDKGKSGRKKDDDLNRTKFLTPTTLIFKLESQSINETTLHPFMPTDLVEKRKMINDLLDEGNQYFFHKNINGYHKGSEFIEYDESFIDIWTKTLYSYSDNIKFQNKIIKGRGKLTQLMYLSNFGTTAAVFNYFPYSLNQDYFTTPSIIEVPYFIAPYLGLLLTLTEDEINEIKEFFLTGEGKDIENNGFLIFADIYDVNKYLAEEDKNYLIEEYNNFIVDHIFDGLANDVENLVNQVEKDYKRCVNEAEDSSRKKQNCKTLIRLENYRKKLVDDYKTIPEILMERVALVCYNEITFRFANDNGTININGNYDSLKHLNDTDTLVEKEKETKKKNDIFFKAFFQKVSTSVTKRIKELTDEENDFKRAAGDEDITTQLYYSFKNINDKWLAGLSQNSKGYPFNNNAEHGLIGQFAFVDRAMNPIGNTIISPEILTTALDDPHATIFSVISQLLSLNGFEFFPLQSFLKFEDNEWEDAFKIDNGPLKKQYPVFVCMYIGGSASYPTSIRDFTDFEDDGIIDIANPGVSDFNGTDCDEDLRSLDDRQLETKNHNVYSEVRAFKVRFGEQNQSMFTDINIDSKEYPETDESIQILAQLAGDNKEQAPIPKAQNLYDLYENRSYQATVTALGNAMIQPTQYFQIDNVPLYNGAYIILSVEHKLTPNKMVTSFTGTKLLKYPMPRVLEPSSIVGFEGGSTTNTNVNASSESGITEGRSAGGNIKETQYNSMYNLKIQ